MVAKKYLGIVWAEAIDNFDTVVIITSLAGLGRLACLEEVLRHVGFLRRRRGSVVVNLAARLADSEFVIIYSNDSAAMTFHVMRSGDKIDPKLWVILSI